MDRGADTRGYFRLSQSVCFACDCGCPFCLLQSKRIDRLLGCHLAAFRLCLFLFQFAAQLLVFGGEGFPRLYLVRKVYRQADTAYRYVFQSSAQFRKGHRRARLFVKNVVKFVAVHITPPLRPCKGVRRLPLVPCPLARRLHIRRLCHRRRCFEHIENAFFKRLKCAIAFGILQEVGGVAVKSVEVCKRDVRRYVLLSGLKCFLPRLPIFTQKHYKFAV